MDNYNFVTTEAMPVVHARWVYEGDDKGFVCTHCHSKCLLDYESEYFASDYCPHCGAIMDLEV